MGLQVNMCKMFNLPDVVQCPKCRKKVITMLGDFDFEAYEPKDGKLEYIQYCEECEHEFPVIIEFNAVIKTA